MYMYHIYFQLHCMYYLFRGQETICTLSNARMKLNREYLIVHCMYCMYYLFRGQETICTLCNARMNRDYLIVLCMSYLFMDQETICTLCDARMNRDFVLVLFDVLYHVLCLEVKKPFVHFVILGWTGTVYFYLFIYWMYYLISGLETIRTLCDARMNWTEIMYLYYLMYCIMYFV